jgi:ribosome-associated translation inhibitor RaiA/DNA-directed RNA polymerase specialized sigma24 family protein
MIKLLLNHEGFAPGAHEGIRETIESWTQRQLAPQLAPFKGELRMQATVKRHGKGEAKYSVSLRLHLPRKNILVADGGSADIHAALKEAENRLLTEVKEAKARLSGQAEYRRKARRLRLRELKAAQAGLPAGGAEQARGRIEPLLPQLERVVRRELAYLRASGELPAEYPSVLDVVDGAVLAVIAHGRPGESADALMRRLLREAFKVLNTETEARRRFGDMLSLESSPEPDAADQAEAMVEEEIYEFYQPDESLQLSDIVPAEGGCAPWTDDQAGERDYALGTLVGLPILWRRVWMLAELERLAMADIADILELELARAERLLDQVRDFLREHLRQAGF